MRVVVRLYGVLKEITGSEVFVFELGEDSSHLNRVLELLINKAPQISQFIVLRKNGEVEVKGVSILVNGRHAVFVGGGSALIRDGDIIDILPPLHGG